MTDVSDLLVRIDTTLLYAPFLLKLEDLLANARDQGSTFIATLGFRTYAEQMKLYFQGRTSPGLIVTHARAGESAHNFGLAVDLTHFTDKTPDWQAENYAILGILCQNSGLSWGKSYGDMPHVQWPGYVTTEELAPLRDLVDTPTNYSIWLPNCWNYVSGNPGVCT